MKKIGYSIFIPFLLLVNSLSYAATGTATGKVGRIYTYNNGQVLFTGFLFTGASCSNNGGFYVPGNHPHINKFISMLLSAKATQSTVTVVAKIDNCWYPEITEGSYFFIE